MGFAVDRLRVFLLHGFLGQASDWKFLLDSKSASANFDLIALDYFRESNLGPEVPMEKWGEALNQFVREKGGEKNYLVGYSLGGRLGLQALAAESSLWAGATFFSIQPGFAETNQTDRELRTESDRQWGQRFAKEDWPQLLRDWNAQKVFLGSAEPKREESSFSRASLQKSLETWSLAKQPDLRAVIEKNTDKINWVVGERDSKFVQIAKDLKEQIPNLQLKLMPNASHRVIFDQPDACAEMLVRQIKKAVNL
jgi:2-succinyl-6-hydroxy-2,4-cyclohexadiene-1-carboxylate synthase